MLFDAEEYSLDANNIVVFGPLLHSASSLGHEARLAHLCFENGPTFCAKSDDVMPETEEIGTLLSGKDQDETKEIMPPPYRLYIPGTQDYEEALRAGRIHCSLGALSRHCHNQKQEQKQRLVESNSVVSSDLEVRMQNFSPENQSPDNNEPAPSAPFSDDLCITDTEMASQDDEIPNSPSASSITDTTGTTNIDSQEDFPSTSDSDRSTVHMEGEKEDGEEVEQDSSDNQAKRDGEAETTSSDSMIEAPTPSFEQTRFSDIIGHSHAKLRIDEVSCLVELRPWTLSASNFSCLSFQILLPLVLPFSIAESILSGVRSQPTSILLFGPPGCGKVRSLHWIGLPAFLFIGYAFTQCCCVYL